MSARGVAVFAGPGSSHSWTWLADLFESRGFYRVRFSGTDEFLKTLDDGSATAMISGGDGFGIASALSGRGFRRLGDFISDGGLYVGVCAGAYLPLPSSIRPFSEFNLSSTKIENIDCVLDRVDRLPPRIAVRYGRCAVVHPVRGELELQHGERTLKAPLYGGPIFRDPEKDRVLLRYSRFTEKTEFQFGRGAASSMVLGRVAAVEATHGRGRLLLLGPHLEHPQYPDANELLAGMLGLQSVTHARNAADGVRQEVSSALADLKVAILGLENRTFVVGKKLWDGSRYLELHRAIQQRAWSMDNGLAVEIATDLRSVRDRLARMDMGAESDVDETTSLLVEAARRCVDNHFRILAGSR